MTVTNLAYLAKKKNNCQTGSLFYDTCNSAISSNKYIWNM